MKEKNGGYLRLMALGALNSDKAIAYLMMREQSVTTECTLLGDLFEEICVYFPFVFQMSLQERRKRTKHIFVVLSLITFVSSTSLFLGTQLAPADYLPFKLVCAGI